MKLFAAAWVLGLTPSAFAQTNEASGEPLFQCWLDTTILLDATPGLDEVLPREASLNGDVSFLTTRLDDGSGARVAGLRVQLDSGGAPGGQDHTVEVVVARRTNDLEETLAQLRLLLVLMWLVSSLGCAAILSWVVRRGLNPLGRLRREIRGLDEASLDHRVQLRGAPEELTPVVDQLNDLLSRLQEAFEREQAFTSHAAHELRTPLAGLRSTLELALSRPRTVEAHREAADSCFQITLQMQSMVEDLLELSRLTGADSRPRARIDIREMIEECRKPYLEPASKKELTWSLSIDNDHVVAGDPNLLRRILHNLVDNAVSYADSASEIEVSVQAGADLEVRVSNQASGAPENVAELAFHPLWRADSARAATGRHAGLGLSLCKKIAEFLGGTVTASYVDETFSVVLRVPSNQTRLNGEAGERTEV